MALVKTMRLVPILVLLFLAVVHVTADRDDDDDDDEGYTLGRRLINDQDDDDEEYGDTARVLARAADRIELETPDLPTAVLLKRMEKLVRLVDEDEDGYLEADEIQEWMENAVERIRTHDTATTFDERDQNDDNRVTWEELLASDPDIKDPKNWEASLPQQPKLKALKQRELREDKELFDAADTDDDGHLTEEEHRAFREPDKHSHTLEVLYHQTMARKDTNGDGALTKREFVSNVDADEDARPVEFDDEERDDDADDVMTKEEILHWLRNDYGTEIKATVAALMAADDNGDGWLSVSEIREEPHLLRRFPLFVEAGARVGALDSLGARGTAKAEL